MSSSYISVRLLPVLSRTSLRPIPCKHQDCTSFADFVLVDFLEIDQKNKGQLIGQVLPLKAYCTSHFIDLFMGMWTPLMSYDEVALWCENMAREGGAPEVAVEAPSEEKVCDICEKPAGINVVIEDPVAQKPKSVLRTIPPPSQALMAAKQFTLAGFAGRLYTLPDKSTVCELYDGQVIVPCCFFQSMHLIQNKFNGSVGFPLHDEDCKFVKKRADA